MGNNSHRRSPQSRRYSPEENGQVVRLVRTLLDELCTSRGTVQRVAHQLGYGPESLKVWVREADIDDGSSAVSRQPPTSRYPPDWVLKTGLDYSIETMLETFALGLSR
jgi:transposase-like protein